jgi:hypothetical protein
MTPSFLDVSAAALPRGPALDAVFPAYPIKQSEKVNHKNAHP